MNLGAGADEEFGAGIRACEAEHLMAGASELSNDRRTDKSRCSRDKHFHTSSLLTRKRFSNHFFAFLPKGRRPLGIERIPAYSFAYAADRHSFGHDFPDMAVFAIAAADLFSRRDDTRPYGSCRSLRDRLPLERSLSLRDELIAHLFDHAFDAAGVDVPAELGLDDSWVHGRGAHPAFAVPLVEGDREENVC